VSRDIDRKMPFFMFRIFFDFMSSSEDKRFYLIFFSFDIMIYSWSDEVSEHSCQLWELMHEFFCLGDEDISGKENLIVFLQ